MIWFSCSKCARTHGRPENSIGTMVFCECGQGNTVPWESTGAEPPPQQAPGATPGRPSTPTLAPLTFDSAAPMSPPRIEDAAVRRRRGNERRDPNFCFNHSAAVRAATCDDCGESFCASCVVTFDAATLCGPCKNFRVRSLELPPRNSTAATFSVLIALSVGSILSFCFLPFGGNNAAIYILSLLTLLPQMLALGLGVRALYLSYQEGENRIGGQAWAITGVTAATLCVTLTLLVNLYAFRA